MIKRLLKILNEPYPEPQSDRVDLLSLLGVGGFVAGFLIIFQPFGIGNSDFPYKNLILAGFGLITILCVLIVDHLIAPLVMRRMTANVFRFKHWIVWTLFVVFVIASANFLYRGLLWRFSLKLYLVVMANTMAIGIFPIIAFGLLNRIRYLKKFGESASQASSDLSSTTAVGQREITLYDERGQSAFSAAQEDILFVRNSDNYISIFTNSDDKQKEVLIRNTMKSLEEQLDNTSLVRCHRGYIVNLKRIKEIKGNAQGWKLRLKGNDEEVPVSRSYIPKLQKLIGH